MSAPIVVVGGGLAAGTFVTQLREHGHDGEVVLLAEEAHAPYERPPLSKDLLLDKGTPEDAAVHESAWYAEHGVDLRTGTSATAIDVAGRRVQAGGDWLDYDELVLATGARPRHLPMADESGAPVALPPHPRRLARAPQAAHRGRPDRHHRRRLDRARGRLGRPPARRRGHPPRVARPAAAARARPRGGAGLRRPPPRARRRPPHRRPGHRRQPHAGTARPSPSATAAPSTSTSSSSGSGCSPTRELAEAAGLTVDNGIRTDARLRTSDEHVHAIGDVANVDHPVLGHPLRVEHWDTAKKHGAALAATLSGTPTDAADLPYFFTDQYDLGMEYVGNPGPEGYDRVVLTGDVPGRVVPRVVAARRPGRGRHARQRLGRDRRDPSDRGHDGGSARDRDLNEC